MFKLEKIGHIHIELTNKCNAACPCCPRNTFGQTNPWLVPRELYLEDIKRIFSTSILQNYFPPGIKYCGNYGDPCVSRDIIEIVKWFKETDPTGYRQQVINTNGGMKNKQFWKSLAQEFKKEDNCGHVTFSIDGLEDTNHLYRKNVIWKKLWENLNTFVENGGNATWEFLVFAHNKHQVEEARKIAESLGIVFEPKRPFGFDTSGQLNSISSIPVYDRNGVYEYSLVSAETDYSGVLIDETKKRTGGPVPVDLPDKMFSPTKTESDYAKNTNIECKSLCGSHIRSHNFYITSAGYVLPCCFMHGVLESKPYNFASYQLKNSVNMDNFDLSKKTLDEIVTGEEMYKTFFKDMNADSLEEGKLLFCADHCGEIAPMDLLYKERKNNE